MIVLRDYQLSALNQIRETIRDGKRKILLVSPTGSGKTVTASEIIRSTVDKGRRALFLAHRKELIEQCSSKLDEFGVDHGVIKSGHPRKNRQLPVQVASIQTLIRREHWPADLIIIDEAHRSVAKTYKDIILRYESPVVLGLTATPYRTSGEGLSEMFEDLVDIISVQELIDDGFLTNPTVFGSKKIDLNEVSTQGGDFHKRELAQAMQNTILHGEIVANWAKICGPACGAETEYQQIDETHTRVLSTDCNACTIVFAVNVEQSKTITEQFRAAGVRAEHVDAKTPESRRSEIFKQLRNREIDVVSNVGLVSEGWDLPHLECVILARPTKSKSLYKQMVGRIMRVDDDKRFAYVLDHANCTRMHGFVNEPTTHSLSSREDRPRKGSAERPIKECAQCGSLLTISAEECPECGYEFPRREVEYTDERLEMLTAENVNAGAPRASAIALTERQENFSSLAHQCVERGFKPNWARVRYQTVYGEWPCKETGIKLPRFFWLYEKSYKKMQRRKLAAEQASKAS